MDEVRYGKLSLLMLNTCPQRLRPVIDNYYSSNVPDFEGFLNNNKHKLFHLGFMECCCSSKRNKKTYLNKSQWDLLFTKVSTKGPHGKKTECPCCYSAISGVSTDVLDVTYCCVLLFNICPGIPEQDVTAIRLVRNDLIHASSATIDEQTFYNTLNKLEQALLNLSRLVSPVFESETRHILQNLKDRLIDPTELEALKQLMTDNRDYERLREVCL